MTAEQVDKQIVEFKNMREFMLLFGDGSAG